MDTVEPLRHAARRLVRELNILDSNPCIEGFTVSQCHLITELESLGEATAKQLGERLVLEKSTMSRLCGGLLRSGHLEAGTDPGDRRRKLLRLTPKGLDGARRIHLFARRQVSGALAFVREEEQPLLLQGLDRYSRALRYARLSRGCSIRRIRRADNEAVAGIIRQVMAEFGAVGWGYSSLDAEVDDMHGAYPRDHSAFFVVESDRRVVGCGGVGPLQGGAADTCELRKMYFLPPLRGTGMGRRLLDTCLQAAIELGYRRCYLETLESMSAARRLYQKYGFEALDRPRGDTGHCGCDVWMQKELVRGGD